jgi:hypothetical protein
MAKVTVVGFGTHSINWLASNPIDLGYRPYLALGDVTPKQLL